MIRPLLVALALAVPLAPALAQPAPAPAAETSAPSRLDAIMARGTLRVGSTGDYKPFTFRDPATGAFSGFDIDMAQALGQALGVKVEVVATSWPNLMKDYGDDRFDVAMGGISVTLDRAKKAYFSIPYLREGKTPITRCGDVSKFQTLEEIDKPETRAVVNPGGTNERFARGNLKQAQITVFPDNTKIFDEIAAGRADLMMTDSSETRFQQRQHPGVLCAVHPEKPFDFAEKAYLLPRDVALKAFVDTWLHLAIETGAYGTLLKKWID